MPGCPNEQNVTLPLSDPESTSAHEVLCKTHRYMDNDIHVRSHCSMDNIYHPVLIKTPIDITLRL